MIPANVTKFGQNFIASPNFFGWYAYVCQGLRLLKYGNPSLFEHKLKSWEYTQIIGYHGEESLNYREKAVKAKTKE